MTPTDPSSSVIISTRDKSRRSMRINMLVFLTVALFVVSLTVLYYQTMTVSEPTCSIRVQGTRDMEGWTVIVAPPRSKPLKARLDARSQFGTRFHLNPGQYEIYIFDRLDEPVWSNLDVILAQHANAVLAPTRAMRATTRPTDFDLTYKPYDE